jgi:hypothetical protein
MQDASAPIVCAIRGTVRFSRQRKRVFLPQRPNPRGFTGIPRSGGKDTRVALVLAPWQLDALAQVLHHQVLSSPQSVQLLPHKLVAGAQLVSGVLRYKYWPQLPLSPIYLSAKRSALPAIADGPIAPPSVLQQPFAERPRKHSATPLSISQYNPSYTVPRDCKKVNTVPWFARWPSASSSLFPGASSCSYLRQPGW